jgi:hypothetical protein
MGFFGVTLDVESPLLFPGQAPCALQAHGRGAIEIDRNVNRPFYMMITGNRGAYERAVRILFIWDTQWLERSEAPDSKGSALRNEI